MPGRGNSVSFGKIILSSEIESMDSIVDHLKDVINSLGYPEQMSPEKKKDLEDAEKKLKKMMSDGSEDIQ
jgi:exonuclease VII small subunit